MGNEVMAQEYHQMTITEWLELKNEIGRELRNVAESFVRIGYTLRKIRDEKLYEQDGYKSITEFAEMEYGLSASLTSRFIAINERYSVDGNSKLLKPEYYGYGQSKLTEMLSLPDADLEMVTPDMQRQDIRELKDFNKQGPKEGEADDRYQLLDTFYKENPEIVKALYGSGASCVPAERMKEIIIPGGNRTYRKGLFFVSFTEIDVKVKKFGSGPETIAWEALRDMTEAVFAGDADGERTYGNHYGIVEEVPDGEEEEDGHTESAENSEERTGRSADEDAHGAEPGQDAPVEGEEPGDGTGNSQTGEADRDGAGGVHEPVPGNDGEGHADRPGGNGETEEGEAGEMDAAEDQTTVEEQQLEPEEFMNPPDAGTFAPAQMEEQEEADPEQDAAAEQRLMEFDYRISAKLKKIREMAETRAYAPARAAALNLADVLKEANMLYGEVLRERGQND